MTTQKELEMWKKMYMCLLRGTEAAAEVLISVEKEAEDLYIEAGIPDEKDFSDSACGA